MTRFLLVVPVVALVAVPGAAPSVSGGIASRVASADAPRSIVLASTTSTDNAGLYDVLLPAFRRDTGIEVKVIAVGTGRALSIARRGDADLLIVHDEHSELEFVRRGYGVERKTFMFNDYVLVGPVADTTGVAGSDGIARALQLIAQSNAAFISRGDDSGTHKKELSLWQLAIGAAPGGEGWYREVGRGMGATLNVANELGAYTLSDRSTWISFNNRADLKVVIENEPPLHNPYSVILVNPERHPGVRFREAKAFAEWLTSERGLALIRDFRVRGQQLFFTY